MIKIKPIIFCAAGAFVLSFLTALIARTGVPISLLKAFIFACVFGGLAVGIQVVFDKFLTGDESSAGESSASAKTTGTKVDLVVSEEDLPADEITPTFSLDSTRHVVTGDDIKQAVSSPSAAAQKESQAEPVAAAAEEVRMQKAAENIVANAAAQKEAPATKNDGFVPVGLASNSAAPESAKAAGGDGLPEIDELPDFGGESSEGVSKGGDEGLIEDSDFAQEGSNMPSHQTEFPDGKLADAKDAAIMAQAIQTVLAHEK